MMMMGYPTYTNDFQARQMYDALGNHWASTLISFLALLCAPIPFLFHRYGPQIRARSKFAASEAVEEIVKQAEEVIDQKQRQASIQPKQKIEIV
jgi:hypothetical protein